MKQKIRQTIPTVSAFMILCHMILCSAAHADTVKHQVTGLFMKEREQDLREAVEKIPNVKLVSIDFKNAEATFEYDPAKAFPGTKAEQVIGQFRQSAANGIEPDFRDQTAAKRAAGKIEADRDPHRRP